MQGGPGILKTTQGRFFWLRLLVPPPPTAFQIRYVFVQKKYAFSMLLLKKFLAVLLVGCEPFPALKKSKVFKYTTFYYS